jgi:hypothetical protein
LEGLVDVASGMAAAGGRSRPAGEKSQTRKPSVSRSRRSSAAPKVAAGKFMLLEKLETMICNLCL